MAKWSKLDLNIMHNFYTFTLSSLKLKIAKKIRSCLPFLGEKIFLVGHTHFLKVDACEFQFSPQQPIRHMCLAEYYKVVWG